MDATTKFESGKTYTIGAHNYTATRDGADNQGRPFAITTRTDGAPLDARNRWVLRFEFGHYGRPVVAKA